MQIPKLYYLCSLNFYIIVTGKINLGKKWQVRIFEPFVAYRQGEKKRFIWFNFFFNQSFKNNAIITAV